MSVHKHARMTTVDSFWFGASATGFARPGVDGSVETPIPGGLKQGYGLKEGYGLKQGYGVKQGYKALELIYHEPRHRGGKTRDR